MQNGIDAKKSTEDGRGGQSRKTSTTDDDDIDICIVLYRLSTTSYQPADTIKMPAPSNTLLIEGSWEELCDELAAYIDTLNTAQEQQTSIQSEIAPLLQENKKEDALKKVVTASAVLNSAPERGETFRPL